MYQIDMNLIQVRFFLQANGGKYQLQNEKTQQSLEKAQSEFDRLQEKFERLTNDSRRVSHSYHYHNTDIPLPWLVLMLKLKIWGQCIQQKCTAYLLAENGTFDVFFRIQSSLPEYYCFTLDSSYYCSYGKISDHFPWIATPEQLIHLLQRRKGAVLRIHDQKLNFCEKKRESCFNTDFNVTYKFHDKLGTMWLKRTNLSEGP